MAVSLNRTLISSKPLFYALRSDSITSHRTLSYVSFPSSGNPRESAGFLSSPATIFSQFNTRRGFARARKQRIEEEEEDELDKKCFDLGTTIKANAQSQMNSAIESLPPKLTKLRTGRASPEMLDHIMVEVCGVKTPLNRIAVVSVLNPITLAVTPYDLNALILKKLKKAIISSPLDLNPLIGRKRLVIRIPLLTTEHVKAICKVISKSSEHVKQSIRRARQKAIDSIKKATPPKKKDKGKEKEKAGPAITDDNARRLEKEIDELTKKFIKTAEDICKAKEKEIKGGWFIR